MLRTIATALVLLASLAPARTSQAQESEGKPVYLRPGGHEKEWAKRDSGPVGHAGADASGFASRTFGVRPFVADGTSGAGQSTFGITARERATGLLLWRWLSARYGDELWLGYDGIDFTGRALIDASFGLRLPVTSYTGPVARLGLFAEATMLAGFSKTELRLGTGEFGWTYARGATHLDLVFQVGPTLLGEVNTGPATRGLSGLTWGPILSAGWEELTLDLRMSQIAADSADGPVTDLRAEVCGLLGGHPTRPTKTTRGKDARVFAGPNGRDFRALMCADVSYGSVDAFAPTAGAAVSPSRWATVGISVLIGRASRLDPLPRLGL